MRLTFITLLALILSACAATAPTATTSGTAYTNGRWFDGKVFRAGDFYVVDRRLTWTKPTTLLETVDLKGGYVVPPFSEAHNHNIDNTFTWPMVNAAYLKDGIYYVKIPNNLERMTRDVRPLTGKRDSIDVVFANGGLTSASGHPIALYRSLLRFPAFQGMRAEDLVDQAYFVVDSDDALAAKWPQIMAGKPDFLKVYLLHSEDHDKNIADARRMGFNGLPPAMVAKIVARAKAAGLRVSAHVETAADFAQAVLSGVDEINHLPGYLIREGEAVERYRITPQAAERAAQRKVSVVTTAGIAANFVRKPEQLKVIQDTQRHNLKLLHEAGVSLAIGSDNYMANAVSEVRYLAKLGAFDNATLLRLWTEDSARSIFPNRMIGRLAEGFEADFLVLEVDPLADIEHTARIRLRVKQGQALDLKAP